MPLIAGKGLGQQDLIKAYEQALPNLGQQVDAGTRDQVNSMLYRAVEDTRNDQLYKDLNKRPINFAYKKQRQLEFISKKGDAQKFIDFNSVSNLRILILERSMRTVQRSKSSITR